MKIANPFDVGIQRWVSIERAYFKWMFSSSKGGVTFPSFFFDYYLLSEWPLIYSIVYLQIPWGNIVFSVWRISFGKNKNENRIFSSSAVVMGAWWEICYFLSSSRIDPALKKKKIWYRKGRKNLRQRFFCQISALQQLQYVLL